MPIFDAIGFEIRRATRLLPTFSQQYLFINLLLITCKALQGRANTKSFYEQTKRLEKVQKGD